MATTSTTTDEHPIEAGQEEEQKQGEREAQPVGHLDTVDVADLQAFNERKTWIIEKTKYLETLTPLEPLRSDNLVYPDRAPGLPTLDEIRVWVREVRTLEKETDQFDKSDLKRLRKTARAAANRHLTPEDTDLVDLTLSTLLALDHLLEAIQQRSEQLDLFGHRVRWEDQRTECEQERRAIKSDLHNFIAEHARWSPSTYEEVSASSVSGIPEHSASTSATAPPSAVRSMTPGFSRPSSARSTPTMAFQASRSQRFQLGQQLATDASRLYMRASNLRQGRVEVSGKLLDRLISLKKIPEPFLDEQDRLEDETDFLRRSLGEFALALAEQWIVADRVYSDCIRHQSEAQAIMADLGRASTKPPNQRLHASLSYRMTNLQSRLSTTAYDVLVFRHIPQPTHNSYSEQEQHNEQIVQTLSEELETAQNLARLAATSVKEYHDALKILHRADKIKEEMSLRKSQLSALAVKLVRGADTSAESSTAPDLSTEACLEPGRHSAYMASLPALLSELDEAGRSADRLVRTARAHLPTLKPITLAPGYMDACMQAITSLESERRSLLTTREASCALASCFNTVCQIWSSTQDIQRSCQKRQIEIQNGLECDRWRPKSPISSSSGPPTPETPSNRMFTDSTSPSEVLAHVDNLTKQFKRAVETPVKSVIPSMTDRLRSHFDTSSEKVKQDLSDLQELAKLWQRVREQAFAMADTMKEADALDNRLSSLLLEASGLWQEVSAASVIPQLADVIDPLRQQCSALRQEIEAFSAGLAARVPFVTGRTQSPLSPYKVRSPKSSTTMPMPQTPPETTVIPSIVVPFDPPVLDDAVRSQINVRCASLQGGIHNLDKRIRLLDRADQVRTLETCLAQAENRIDDVFKSLDARTQAITALASNVGAESTKDVQLALEALESEATELITFASALDQLLHDIMTGSQEAHDDVQRTISADKDNEDLGGLLKPRLKRLEALEDKEDQLHKNSAAALRELRDVSTALAKRLALLESEEADSLAKQKEETTSAMQRASPHSEAPPHIQEETVQQVAPRNLAFPGIEEDEANIPDSLSADISSGTILVPIPREDGAYLAPVSDSSLSSGTILIPMPQEDAAYFPPTSDSRSPSKVAPRGKAKTSITANAHTEQSRTVSSPSRNLPVPSVVVTRDSSSREDVLPNPRFVTRTAGSPSRRIDLKSPPASPKARRSSALSLMTNMNTHPVEKQENGVVESDENEKEEDVFGTLVPLTENKDAQMMVAKAHVLSDLRTTLSNLKLEELAHSLTPESQFSMLPTHDIVDQARSAVAIAQEKIQDLAAPSSDVSTQAQGHSLRQELNVTVQLIPRLEALASFAAKIDECDAGINEIISQLDTYPDAPQSSASPSVSGYGVARRQLSALLENVSATVQTALEAADGLADDFRVLNERMRIEQIWAEAKDEANDRLDPAFVRTKSAMSLSSLSSSTSINHLSTPSLKKPSLSRQSSTTILSGRSSVLSASTGGPWIPSVGIKPTSRSVSGPLPRTPASRLPRPTDSPTPSAVLRQRAESVVSNYTQRSRQSLDSFAPVWTRGISDTRRRKSSMSSEVTPTRPRNMSMSSSWSRTPRQSFGSPMLPSREGPKKRQYVANPKNKLDVAVGNVINRLPVNVNVRPLPGWKDQSGKYYIGDANVKPYFCRILRSQTVMVRVGGGWMELSKFIRGHFAELFRILPPGPLTPPIKEPWISSATLLKAAGSPLQAAGSPLASPVDPSSPFSDPKTPSPAHAGDLSNSSLFSLASSSSPGSPLASIQFLRKADEFGRLSQSPTLRNSTTSKHKSQGKASGRGVWRP
ncbi:hypothetical protein DACRYDRAFT_113167 [Dacryopinax primogenitus]|uniref:GAR domain-containing protein n=1 Tax=Dacryopinax primogenitus (strain DJM 731) TaxID=1858805 RepID=M5GBU3_DACPD|nr:uncharacterized protein DACRYDRAFT_113167 [Dacryopinax primogenitus]EJU06464.1 hypothetical protein DACRYDRAFT_113167 [Dacryopinax primogenitus]